jgi:hypothetical protein
VDPVFVQNLAELMWDFAVYTALLIGRELNRDIAVKTGM